MNLPIIKRLKYSYRKIKPVCLWLTIFIVVGCTWRAEACNQLSLQSVGSIDLNSMRLGVMKNFRVEKKSGTCSFVVSFDRGSMLENFRVLRGASVATSTSASYEIRYGIYQDTSKQIFLGDESFGAGAVLKGSFSQSGFESMNFSIYVSVNDTQLNKGSGFYRDLVEIRLHKSLPTGPELVSSNQIPIVYYQHPFYELMLAAAGGSKGGLHHRLNFDRLEKGKTLGFDILVKSNVPHKISFRSQNLGRLRNQSFSDQYVPYSFSVQGQEVDLRRGEVSVTPDAALALSGEHERLNGQVQIQEVSQALSGPYRDFISIVVEAQ